MHPKVLIDDLRRRSDGRSVAGRADLRRGALRRGRRRLQRHRPREARWHLHRTGVRHRDAAGPRRGGPRGRRRGLRRGRRVVARDMGALPRCRPAGPQDPPRREPARSALVDLRARPLRACRARPRHSRRGLRRDRRARGSERREPLRLHRRRREPGHQRPAAPLPRLAPRRRRRRWWWLARCAPAPSLDVRDIRLPPRLAMSQRRALGMKAEPTGPRPGRSAAAVWRTRVAGSGQPMQRVPGRSGIAAL